MPLDEERAASSLGERLREGVLKLWKEVGRLSKIADHHGGEIEGISLRLAILERELRGLKVSRGRVKAKNVKLESALSESEKKLAEIRAALN